MDCRFDYFSVVVNTDDLRRTTRYRVATKKTFVAAYVQKLFPLERR